MELFRWVSALVLAVVAAVAVDAAMQRRGRLPPRFRMLAADDVGPLLRRVLAGGLLAGVLYLAVALPVAFVGSGVDRDLDSLAAPQLFTLHAVLTGVLALWYVLAYVPARPGEVGWTAQLGLRAPRLAREVTVGVVAGFAIWAVVLVLLILLSALIALSGGEEALPDAPPELTLWMAGLPWPTRTAVALSAGLVEETFFRGFLQPRIGVAFSTALFTLAHLSYEQPLMLVGVTVLSLFFAGLVAWRQSIWAAVTAHAIFDLVQLLVILPLATRFFAAPGGGEALIAWAGRLLSIC